MKNVTFISAILICFCLVLGCSSNKKEGKKQAKQSYNQSQNQTQKEEKPMTENKELTIKEKGEQFLRENRNKDGVKVTNSGLQYKVLKEGSGASPKPSDMVKVHYEGKSVNGKIFDSSYQRNQPATFGVTQVIKGWVEALQLMKEGDIWEVYIPSELAYGTRGAGSAIQPDEMLIFKIELLEIVN